VPSWSALMKENDPGAFTTVGRVPVLIIQGGADEQIPVPSTQSLAQQYCQLGATVERWVYPGQSHAGVIPVSMPDMVHWMADRFAAGVPSTSTSAPLPPDPYQPVGEPGVTSSACPA
jgi:hypothetical protein